MDLKDIKELMKAMRQFGTKRIVIKNKEIELELEREIQMTAQEGQMVVSPERNRESMVFSQGGMMPVYHHGPVESASSASPAQQNPTKVEEEVGKVVTSPMVGTFYSSPSPDDPSFVKVGDKVEKDTVLCIIEAMKVMNEVKAGVSGTIEEVFVETGHPVEFGTKLFRIK